MSGSTTTNKWINIIQWVTLFGFSLAAMYYRWTNHAEATQWAFTGTWDIVKFHSLPGRCSFRPTIAILILVGFESCTALSAETKNPETTIPKAIIISLIAQGLICYLVEYFATGYMPGQRKVDEHGRNGRDGDRRGNLDHGHGKCGGGCGIQCAHRRSDAAPG